MILVGQYDSPYVRRVAVSLHLLDIAFSRNPMSVFSDAEAMRRINPLGRVPSLVLDDGEVLVDSSAILDHLDEVVGATAALLPRAGSARRRALQVAAIASGMTDKAIAIGYERMLRPVERQYEPWVERNRGQLSSALSGLEAMAPDRGWFAGDKPGQADITVATSLGYLRFRRPWIGALPPHPKLHRLSQAAEALPAFRLALPGLAEIGGPEAEAQAGLARFQGIA
jgi:glutathione S-transferase